MMNNLVKSIKVRKEIELKMASSKKVRSIKLTFWSQVQLALFLVFNFLKIFP